MPQMHSNNDSHNSRNRGLGLLHPRLGLIVQGAVKYVGCSAFGSFNHYRNHLNQPAALEFAKDKWFRGAPCTVTILPVYLTSNT
jgi:hypothetical protein